MFPVHTVRMLNRANATPFHTQLLIDLAMGSRPYHACVDTPPTKDIATPRLDHSKWEAADVEDKIYTRDLFGRD